MTSKNRVKFNSFISTSEQKLIHKFNKPELRNWNSVSSYVNYLLYEYKTLYVCHAVLKYPHRLDTTSVIDDAHRLVRKPDRKYISLEQQGIYGYVHTYYEDHIDMLYFLDNRDLVYMLGDKIKTAARRNLGAWKQFDWSLDFLNRDNGLYEDVGFTGYTNHADTDKINVLMSHIQNLIKDRGSVYLTGKTIRKGCPAIKKPYGLKLAS
jgi:hypothetical protein